MTEEEIAELGVPYTTLQDWKKPSNKRHPLYKLLTNLDKEEADKLLKKGSVHRLQHVLNRNVAKEFKYSYEEIQGAFKNTHYEQLDKRQQNVVDLFFKECDTDDVKSLNNFFEIPRGNLKKLYEGATSLRKITGISKVWDRKFRLKKIKEEQNMFIVKKKFKPMLLLTVNNSIGNKKNHLNEKQLVEIFKKTTYDKPIDKYVIKTIKSEATKEEIEWFSKKFLIPKRKVDHVLSATID